MPARRGRRAHTPAPRRASPPSGATGLPADQSRNWSRGAEEFAWQLETLPEFYSYQVMDCGDGDIIAVSRFRERTSAKQSDELAARFARTELTGFDLKRNEWLGGGVILVSREADPALRPSTGSPPES